MKLQSCRRIESLLGVGVFCVLFFIPAVWQVQTENSNIFFQISMGWLWFIYHFHDGKTRRPVDSLQLRHWGRKRGASAGRHGGVRGSSAVDETLARSERFGSVAEEPEEMSPDAIEKSYPVRGSGNFAAQPRSLAWRQVNRREGQDVSFGGLSRLCSNFRILASALARASGSNSKTSRVN